MGRGGAQWLAAAARYRPDVQAAIVAAKDALAAYLPPRLALKNLLDGCLAMSSLDVDDIERVGEGIEAFEARRQAVCPASTVGAGGLPTFVGGGGDQLLGGTTIPPESPDAAPT